MYRKFIVNSLPLIAELMTTWTHFTLQTTVTKENLTDPTLHPKILMLYSDNAFDNYILIVTFTKTLTCSYQGNLFSLPVLITTTMVDVNIVQQLEQDGMEYRNAFKVANLMETEGISKQEAIKRVTEDIVAAEQAAAQAKEEFKVKEQVPEGAGVTRKSKPSHG